MDDYFQDISLLGKLLEFFDKRVLSIEEQIHVNFNETNTKSVEVDVIDYAYILEKKHPEQINIKIKTKIKIIIKTANKIKKNIKH